MTSALIRRQVRRQASLQTEAHPQRNDSQGDGHDYRQREHPGVITQQRRHLHRRHAAVVHGTNTSTNQHTADAELQQAQITSRQQIQGDPGGCQARQHGQQRDTQVETHRRTQLESEHAEKVHGPDATAEREGTGKDGDLPGDGVGTVARLTSQLQRHASGEHGNGQ